jgi:hypothetical protein
MNPHPEENHHQGPADQATDDQPPGQAEEVTAPAPPPSAPAIPRAVTRMVSWRALTEPRARFWVLTSLVLACIAIGFFINSLVARAHEKWLIANGLHINATVRMANDEFVARRPQPPESVVMLRFPWNGQDFDTHVGRLPGRKERIETGSTIAIHVNPQNPDDWTWLNKPLPLLDRAIGTIITLPMAALALLWALRLRARFLHTWRKGEAVEAFIVETRSTAVAPRSRAAEVTPVDENDRRIYTVFLPRRLADLEEGDHLCILRRSNQATTAVAAAWFE